MAESKVDAKSEVKPTYIPTSEERMVINDVLGAYTKSRLVIDKNYNQFNNRNLLGVIDDWTLRWNGYIPPRSVLADGSESRIFLNFTRNAIIAYLAKVAMTPPKSHIVAVNKKNGLEDKKLADVLEDLNSYSLDNESGPARFLEAALECTTKGTVIVYEGYKKEEQKRKVPITFDPLTGKAKFKEEKVTIFDDCFQKVVPLEDFYISNPYQADIQKQPFVIWHELTTYDEAKEEYGHYENFKKYVRPGLYAITNEPTTFYRNKLYTELSDNQVDKILFYRKKDNMHVVLINGIPIYEGPIPFKDGRYPFAKGIYTPYANDFFWGAGFAQTIMGEQDLMNTMFNMMVDKTYGSLLPYGLSSDLDDLVEDEFLAPNKIRKVSDINKWKFDTLPGVSSGEQNMLQTVMNFARENAGGALGAGSATTPKGGKMQVRQVLLQQQEAMQKLGFPMNFLEDMERDRTILRVNHILQFYSIPKIEKITAKNGKEIQKLVYRDVKLSSVELSDGSQGNRIVKLVDGEALQKDKLQTLQDEMSVLEEQGAIAGVNTEALALNIDTFQDYNFSIQVVKNSSYERNQILDQAQRHEYANWRLSLAQAVPVDAKELVKWVDESYDIDTNRFEPKQQDMAAMQALQGQPGQGQPSPAKQMMQEKPTGGSPVPPISALAQ